MSVNLTLGQGLTIGSGISFGAGTGGGGGTAGIDGAIGINEIGSPVIPSNQLEDPTATVNGSTGFTINDNGHTGVAIQHLTPSNLTFFSSYGTGTKTMLLGPGSTRSSTTVNIMTNSSSVLIFFITQPGASETYNYPFTFI